MTLSFSTILTHLDPPVSNSVQFTSFRRLKVNCQRLVSRLQRSLGDSVHSNDHSNFHSNNHSNNHSNFHSNNHSSLRCQQVVSVFGPALSVLKVYLNELTLLVAEMSKEEELMEQVNMLKREAAFLEQAWMMQDVQGKIGQWAGKSVGTSKGAVELEQKARDAEIHMQIQNANRIEKEIKNEIMNKGTATREEIAVVEYASELKKMQVKTADNEVMNQAMQDKLAEEIADMAAALKENVQKIKESIVADNKIVEEAEAAASKNKDKLVAENLNLRDYSSSAFGATWYFVLALAFTLFVLVGMIIFMKIVPKPRYL